MSKREREQREKRRSSSARDWAKKASSGDSTCIKLPAGVEWDKLETGIKKKDFVPYIVGGRNPNADEGMEHFELTYERHSVPTPSGTKYYSCRKFFGKRCAVCDWLTKNGNNADPELVKSLRPSTRHLWATNDKPGDLKNPVKVMETNHWNKKKGFGEQVSTAIQTLPDDDDPFALVGGYTVVITGEEETFPGGKYVLASRIDFHKRKYDYPDDYCEKVPNLEACVVDPGYDEVMALLEVGSPNEEKEETVSPKSSSNGEKVVNNTKIKVGYWVLYKKEECKVVKVDGDGSLTIENDDGDFLKAIDPADVTVLPTKQEEEDDEPAPAKKEPSKPAQSRVPVEEEEDEDEPDLDEDEDDDLEEFEDEEDSGKTAVTGKRK